MPASSHVEISHGKRRFTAELHLPDGNAPAPGILLLHDILGVNPMTIADAEDLANEGFVVLTPDLYSLFGRTKYCIRQFFHPASLANSRDNPALPEIETLIAYLKNHKRVDSERLGMFGACLTGGYVLQMAKRADMLAPVLNHHSLGIYGAGFPEAEASEVRHTVQGHFCEKDKVFCPKRRADKLKALLGDRLDFRWHKDMNHGIRTYERRNPQSTVSWEQTKSFYRQHLLA